MRSGMVVLLCCGLLAGCSNLDPRLDPQGALFTQDVQRMTEDYNHVHGTRYPVPQLNEDEMASLPSVVGAADYSRWTIHINKLWVRKDPCTVRREALAHELAHLFVYYDQFGPPQTAFINTSRGMQLVAMNGPGLQDSSVEHGSQWQVKARELGADPCREGYCFSERPYKKYPPECDGGMLAAAPSAPPAIPVQGQ
jgi:hypothetical protein